MPKGNGFLKNGKKRVEKFSFLHILQTEIRQG